MRNEALREVVESEKIYANRLKFCINHFMKPLDDLVSMRKSVLSPEQISSIFGQIGSINFPVDNHYFVLLLKIFFLLLDVIEALSFALLNELELTTLNLSSNIGQIFTNFFRFLENILFLFLQVKYSKEWLQH